MHTAGDQPIVLFDGICNLCASSVQFILKNEKKSTIVFASLQSSIGRELRQRFGIDPDLYDSIIYIEKNEWYAKSKAITKICKHLKFPWKIFSWFHFVPKWLGYPLYDIVAKNRYVLFGKKESCWIPNVQWRSRFLDNNDVS